MIVRSARPLPEPHDSDSANASYGFVHLLLAAKRDGFALASREPYRPVNHVSRLGSSRSAKAASLLCRSQITRLPSLMDLGTRLSPSTVQFP